MEQKTNVTCTPTFLNVHDRFKIIWLQILEIKKRSLELEVLNEKYSSVDPNILSSEKRKETIKIMAILSSELDTLNKYVDKLHKEHAELRMQMEN